MMSMVGPMRRLAVAARASDHAAVVRGKFSALTLRTTRSFSVAPSTWRNDKDAVDSKTLMALHTRIAGKMTGLFKTKHIHLDNVGDEIETTVQYLVSRLDMPRIRAIRAIALHPMMTTYTPDTMDAKLQWLSEAGLDKAMLRNVMQRHPMIIGRSEQSMEESRNWFLKQGIPESKLPFMYLVFPQCVSFAASTLDAKVETLQSIGLTDGHVRRVLQRFPQVLTGSAKSMLAKVEFAKDMGMTDESVVRLITLVPEYLSLDTAKVALKVKSLDKLFGDDAGIRLWSSYPRLVMCNQIQLRRSFNFLHEVVGLPADQIAANGHLMMRNVDRILHPRYEFLKFDNESEELDRTRWILASEAKFHDQYPSYREFLHQQFVPTKGD